MENIEDADVAVMRRKPGADIAVGEGYVRGGGLGHDVLGGLDFPKIVVEAVDGDAETLGPQE